MAFKFDPGSERYATEQVLHLVVSKLQAQLFAGKQIVDEIQITLVAGGAVKFHQRHFKFRMSDQCGFLLGS